jgi:hypothetical protein
MKHFALLLAAGSVAATALPAQAAELPAAPAPIVATFHDSASPFTSVVAAYDDDDWRDRRDRRRWREDRRDDRRWEGRRGDTWRGDDGRWRCRRSDGTTGLLVGAVGGALLGRTVDTRGDRSLGTILGAVGGGLLGREVDRGGGRCR